MTANLALEQAPPLSVPLRFFLTAPLFGIAAAALLLWLGPDALASRWTPAALALAHLFALGVIVMVMLGALLQMLPVLVGVPVAAPRLLGGLCHLTFTLGVALLASGFVAGEALMFRAAGLLLGFGLGLFVLVVGSGLARAPHANDSVRGMRWALAGFAVTIALGLWLAFGHAAVGLPLRRIELTDLHVGWGLLGWIAVLVAVVAYQVVPMFQMTAAYPAWLRRGLAPALFGLLSWLSLAAWLRWPLWLPEALLALLVAVFALVTLGLLGRRRRKVGDASLGFWRLGMLALLGAAIAAVPWRWLPIVPGSALAMAPMLLFLLGFALSVVSGMLYKIVPFLVWLHLQQRLSAFPKPRAALLPPNMKTILPDRRARPQLYLHAEALVMLLAGLAFPILLRPAALLWLGSFALLGFNLLMATRCYLGECRRIDAAAAESLGSNMP
jgi:hypothetical protein